jgi:Putative addiction module component
MIRNTAKVMTDALSLPSRSRAKLADKLLESLDQSKQRKLDKLRANEVENRIDAYVKG